MKCPDCGHDAETPFLLCAACGEQHKREPLKTIDHLEYLISWLDDRAQGLGRETHAKLIAEASSQLEKIHELRKSFKREIAPLRSQKYEKKAELRLLWIEPQPSREKIKAKQKELHDLIWRLINMETDYRFTFRDILTREQLSRFLDMGGILLFRHRGNKSGVTRSR